MNSRENALVLQYRNTPFSWGWFHAPPANIEHELTPYVFIPCHAIPWKRLVSICLRNLVINTGC